MVVEAEYVVLLNSPSMMLSDVVVDGRGDDSASMESAEKSMTANSSSITVEALVFNSATQLKIKHMLIKGVKA